MGAYLSAREAADYCGVSEKTVRNWLHAGRLSAEKSEGTFRIPQEQLDTLRRHDPRSPHPADRQPEGSAEDVRAEGPQAVPVADVLALLRDAQAEAITKAEAAAMWQVRAEVLAAQLELARTELRALQAPHVAQNATQASNLTAEAPEPSSEPSDPPTEPPEPLAPDPLPPTTDGRTPWWRHWWRWASIIAV